MYIDFKIDGENESFTAINMASAIIDNIENLPSMSESAQNDFLMAISEHIRIHCQYKFVR